MPQWTPPFLKQTNKQTKKNPKLVEHILEWLVGSPLAFPFSGWGSYNNSSQDNVILQSCQMQLCPLSPVALGPACCGKEENVNILYTTCSVSINAKHQEVQSPVDSFWLVKSLVFLKIDFIFLLIFKKNISVALATDRPLVSHLRQMHFIISKGLL